MRTGALPGFGFNPPRRRAIPMRLAAVVPGVGLFGCAVKPVVPADTLPAGLQVRVLIARTAAVGTGPVGVSDRFTLDRKMVVYVTFVWPDEAASWGTQKFETLWYSGDRLVKKNEPEYKILRSPFHFWSTFYPVSLGSGPARYEIHVNGRKLAEHSFEIFGLPPTKDASKPVKQDVMYRQMPGGDTFLTD